MDVSIVGVNVWKRSFDCIKTWVNVIQGWSYALFSGCKVRSSQGKLVTIQIPLKRYNTFLLVWEKKNTSSICFHRAAYANLSQRIFISDSECNSICNSIKWMYIGNLLPFWTAQFGILAQDRKFYSVLPLLDSHFHFPKDRRLTIMTELGSDKRRRKWIQSQSSRHSFTIKWVSQWMVGKNNTFRLTFVN